MKKFLLGTVGLIALGMAPASAADLAARPYTKAPPMISPIYDWSGFYIGANGGWASQRNCWTAFDSTFTINGGNEGCHDADGGVAGGQIGYRWQSAAWVFGLEAQGNWADLRGSNGSLLFVDAAGVPLTNQSRMDAFGLFTGQVGWAWNNTLLYVKGGAAVTDNSYRVFDSTGTLIARTDDDTRWGAVVGAGLEFGFAPNWSAGVEYDHIFLGDRNMTFTDPATGLFAGADRISGDVDMVTVRVNYRWGGPVIGRY